MILTVLNQYLEGALNKGYIEQFKQMCYDFYYNRKFSKYPFQFHTVQNYELHTLQGDTNLYSKNKDNFRNQPSPYYEIFRALHFIPIKRQEISFLDIGCGNGRVMVSAISLGFPKLIGIDIDPVGVALAGKNCELAKNVFSDAQYQVQLQDAATYEVPAHVNVIFLSNPFGTETLSIVIDGIAKSHQANPRTLYLLYFNPLYPAVIEHIFGIKRVLQLQFKTRKPDLYIYKVSK